MTVVWLGVLIGMQFSKEMKSKFPLSLGYVFCPILVFLLLGIGGYFYLQHSNYNSALDATQEWAQLSEFPSSATNLTVVIQGSMLTREFIVEFDAPLADIEKWLNESPGTKVVKPMINGSVRRYNIEPGGGASHAELEMDESTGHVRINSYWS